MSSEVDQELHMEMDESAMREVLTVEEAARLLRISRATTYEGIRAGEIPAIRIGRRVLVPKQRLLALLGHAPDR